MSPFQLCTLLTTNYLPLHLISRLHGLSLYVTFFPFNHVLFLYWVKLTATIFLFFPSSSK